MICLRISIRIFSLKTLYLGGIRTLIFDPSDWCDDQWATPPRSYMLCTYIFCLSHLFFLPYVCECRVHVPSFRAWNHNHSIGPLLPPTYQDCISCISSLIAPCGPSDEWCLFLASTAFCADVKVGIHKVCKKRPKNLPRNLPRLEFTMSTKDCKKWPKHL
jgi:hypothetical protein